MLTLLVLQGPDKGRRFELPDATTLVGRESRQLPLTDNTVSRRHCELIYNESGEWVLRDLGSSNGSYVNGMRIVGKHGLKLGDQVRVGRTLMVFGSQPGVSRATGGNVRLAGEESGMDSAIMAAIPANEDSMVLAVPEPAAAAMSNLKILYQLRHRPGPRSRHGPGLRARQGRPRHHPAHRPAQLGAGPQGRAPA
jgi:two-component system NtrC family sensor kinase